MPILRYSKTLIKRSLKKRTKTVFKANYCLMQVKSITKCSMGSILQYFRPSLNYSLSLRSLFCQFLSGHLRKVLLYVKVCIYLSQVKFRIFTISTLLSTDVHYLQQTVLKKCQQTEIDQSHHILLYLLD